MLWKKDKLRRRKRVKKIKMKTIKIIIKMKRMQTRRRMSQMSKKLFSFRTWGSLSKLSALVLNLLIFKCPAWSLCR